MINPHVADLSAWLNSNSRRLAAADISVSGWFRQRDDAHMMRIVLRHQVSGRTYKIETRLPQEILIEIMGGAGDSADVDYLRPWIAHPRGDMFNICELARTFVSTAPERFVRHMALQRVGNVVAATLRKSFTMHMEIHGCEDPRHPEHIPYHGRCASGAFLLELLPLRDEIRIRAT